MQWEKGHFPTRYYYELYTTSLVFPLRSLFGLTDVNYCTAISSALQAYCLLPQQVSVTNKTQDTVQLRMSSTGLIPNTKSLLKNVWLPGEWWACLCLGVSFGSLTWRAQKRKIWLKVMDTVNSGMNPCWCWDSPTSNQCFLHHHLQQCQCLMAIPWPSSQSWSRRSDPEEEKLHWFELWHKGGSTSKGRELGIFLATAATGLKWLFNHVPWLRRKAKRHNAA